MLIAFHLLIILFFIFTQAGLILLLLFVLFGDLNDLLVEGGMILELLGNPENWWVALVGYLELIRFALLHLRLLLRYLEIIIDHAVVLNHNPLVKLEGLESLRTILKLPGIEGESWNAWVVSLIRLILRKMRELSFFWLLIGLAYVLRWGSPLYLIAYIILLIELICAHLSGDRAKWYFPWHLVARMRLFSINYYSRWWRERWTYPTSNNSSCIMWAFSIC